MKEETPNKKITNEQIRTAILFILENPDKEDFIMRNCRVTNQEGDDNSMELAGYWREQNDIISQHLVNLKELTVPPSAIPTDDYKQYITNLLYAAYNDGKQQISTAVFDLFVEEQIEVLKEFQSIHPQSSEREKKQEELNKTRVEYISFLETGDNVYKIEAHNYRDEIKKLESDIAALKNKKI
jgi:hypothetical protein